jgi:hypothetical protein
MYPNADDAEHVGLPPAGDRPSKKNKYMGIVIMAYINIIIVCCNHFCFFFN